MPRKSHTPRNLPSPPDTAAVLLEQALKIVTGARRVAYGNPEDNFATIATLWEAYLARRRQAAGPCFRIGAQEVAAMMCLMKIARLAESPKHTDSCRDLIGYGGCYGRAAGVDTSEGAP